MTEPVPHGKFEVGGFYYQCGFTSGPSGAILPLVDTWVYAGIVRGSCVGGSCSSDRQFYRFYKLKPGKPHDDSEGCRSRSLSDAEKSYWTWDELQIQIHWMNEDIKEQESLELEEDCGDSESGKI